MIFRRQFASCTALSKAAGKTHKSPVSTRFPTKYNPVRSAYKQVILLPEGVVYNPAPSAPTPLETPAAFLPATDKRSFRKDDKDFPVDLMPALSEAPLRTSHLTAEDCEKIQNLRYSEPEKWTRKALAAEFKVSEQVIGMVSNPHPDRAKEMANRLETIKGIWNDKRARARMHKEWRKQAWLRDA